jgi:hypothetical protein
MMRITARAAAPFLALLVLACSGPGSQAADPMTVLRQAGQAMAGLHSVAADVRFGPGIVLQGLTLTSATARIQVPGDSDTVFKVKQGDFLLDLRVVTSGGRVFLRLPFSSFTELSADEARKVPDLSALFDQRAGLPFLLTAGRDVRSMGTEQVSGVDSDKVATTYTASQVGQLLGGFQPAGDVQATIWAGRSDHLVRQVVLSGPLLEAGRTVSVQVSMHDFNQPMAIAVPSPT